MGRGAPQSLRDVAKVRPRGRDEKWETLKRRAQLLARLGGPTASLAEGLHVVSIAAVKEPALVVARLRARGVLTVAELAKAATLEQMSVPVTREHLAAAHRDVRALSTAPALAMARDRRRALARYGDIDEAWLTEKRRRIDGLASSLARHEGAPPRTADAWFESVLEIVGIVHGAASRDALAESARRLTALGAEQRRRAVERVEALLTALATGDPLADEHADLAPLVPRLARAAELPGRSRRARVLDVLRSVIAWPEAPAAAVKDLAEPLARRAFDAAVRAAATAIIRALPTDRDRDARDRTLEMLAFYGLAFRSGASDGGVPLLSSADIDDAIEKKEAATSLIGTNISFAEALRIVALPVKEWHRDAIARLVAGGLDIELAALACEQGHGYELANAANAKAARAFATWATKLVPHYAKHGITLDLSARLFANLPRNEDVAMLAVCLIEESRAKKTAAETKRNAVAGAPADPIVVLDATLGLFEKLPQKATAIIGQLLGTSKGAGRAAFPELATWLDDDALLDRYVHVARLARVPMALTKGLREDFERTEKASRERAHLEALTTRSPRQDARLQTLAAQARADVSSRPGRTRRRIGERIAQLLPLAYRRELDELFRHILRDAWSIDVPHMTPAWRDAVRFWLGVQNNRELLGRLLREAARQERGDRADIKLAFPKNRPWLEKHRATMNVDAWMAPRARELTIGTNRYTIALEDDPLEVLRMGIPFGTCLSLDDGCNAASTIVNAIDANKRVLYVRGRDGRVVARKLLAITNEKKLLGYNLYLSIRGKDELAIRAAVLEMCRTIAADVGVAFGKAGAPESLHGGFWYDDGTVDWEEDIDVAAFCGALGLKTPAEPTRSLREEARDYMAVVTRDVDIALRHFSYWDTGAVNMMVGDWLGEHLGVRDLERRAKESTGLQEAILRIHERRGEEGMLDALAYAGRLGSTAILRLLGPMIAGFPRSARLARALADVTARLVKKTRHHSKEELPHATFDMLPRWLDGIEASFDTLDRIEPAWDAFVEAIPSCRDCRRHGWVQAILAVADAFDRAPDEDAVLSCLTSRHRGELSQRAALGIAARRLLPNGARALGRLGALRPAVLVSPYMLAASLRQEQLTEITDAHVARLPKPERAPFEALGPLLFEVAGIERLLTDWPKVTPEAWNPGPWELAWYWRRPSSPMHGELERIAKKRAGVPSAIDVVRAMQTQVDLADRGELPTFEARKDVVDRRLRDVATTVLVTEGHAPEMRRDAADVIAHVVDANARWDGLLTRLARLGDATSVKRILDTCVASSHRDLAPETTVAMWQLPSIRPYVAASLTRIPSVDWTRAVTACSRAAARDAGAGDVKGLLEACALSLIDRSSFSIVTHTDTLDELRAVCRVAAERASPARAAAFYEALDAAVPCSFFLAAIGGQPRSRIDEVIAEARTLSFERNGGAMRKAWLVDDLLLRVGSAERQDLKKPGKHSIERG